jgi:pyruvate,water dikinase
LNDLLTFQAECSKIHARLTGADILVTDFILTAQKMLGWNESKSLELLSGLSFTTTELTKRLGELAQIAKKNPLLVEMLSPINNETVKKIAEVDNEFATAFEKYIEEFGVRTLSWELNKETLEERPDFILQLVHNQIENNYDFDSEVESIRQNREKLLKELNHLLSSKSKDEQEELRTILKKAERAYPTREDHEYYLHITPLALLRKTFLEIGKRLQDQEILRHKDDIFFLELDEVKEVFTNKIDKRQTVKRRKGELAWALANPGPNSYGGPSPPPPSLKGFPPEVKRVMEGMLWMIEGNASIEYLQEKTNSSTDKISGIPASAGQYTGPVRIIMSDEDFHKLQPGDVLVCPTTQPPWSVLFPSVGALVTDGGGILSHPAIIAREYHIPAIVATGNATKVLHDNQIITVDGNSGHIIIKVILL